MKKTARTTKKIDGGKHRMFSFVPEILHEDDNYIFFNKPAGLVVHADGRSKEATLADWLVENRPEMKEVGEPLVIPAVSAVPATETTPEKPAKEEIRILRPGIVHRLDKETSGVMVVAKTPAAFADLKEKFQNREVQKTYHAFVYGNLNEEDGTINRPIGRSKSDFRKWSAQRGARGEMRDAITNYKVLVRGDGFDFVEAEPKTGRTHQIRVHFKAVHHPVVADALYAPNQPKTVDEALGFKRVALHARRISFVPLAAPGAKASTLPQRLSIEAPYPADFEAAIEVMKKVAEGTSEVAL